MPQAVQLCHTMLACGLSAPGAVVVLLRSALRRPLLEVADDAQELRLLKAIEMLLRVDFLVTQAKGLGLSPCFKGQKLSETDGFWWRMKRNAAAVEGFKHLSAMRTRRISIAMLALTLLLVMPSPSGFVVVEVGLTIGALCAYAAVVDWMHRQQAAKEEERQLQVENKRLRARADGREQLINAAPSVATVACEVARFRMDRRGQNERMKHEEEEHQQKMEIGENTMRNLDEEHQRKMEIGENLVELTGVICWCLKGVAYVAGFFVALRLVLFGFFRTLYDFFAVYLHFYPGHQRVRALQQRMGHRALPA